MKKKIGCILLSSLLCFFCFMGCTPKKSEYEIARDRITQKTEIEIPTDSKIVYHFYRNTGFGPGRDPQYTVFQFESEPKNWLSENSFNKERNNEFESYFSGGIRTLPDDIEEIPQEFLPNFEESYYYLFTTNFVYFVYIPQNLLLIVLISGH